MFLRTLRRSQGAVFTMPRRRRGGGDGGCSSDTPGAVQGPVPTNFPVMSFTNSGSAMPTLNDDGSVGMGTMRTVRPTESEDFFFKDQKALINISELSDGNQAASSSSYSSAAAAARKEQSYFCRLCQEDIPPPFTPRQHILASSRSSHLNHGCRETTLDTMALLSRRGYPIENIVRIWSRVLYNHPEFCRISSLSSPELSLRDRGAKLLELLHLLVKCNVIETSLGAVGLDSTNADASNANGRRRAAMERAECIGDNSWGHHMSHRMMALFPDRQFLYSQFAYTYNTFRDSCEMNLTLEWMYDLLQIGMLFPKELRDRVGNGKVKADILEAVLGELHLTLFGFLPGIFDSVPYVEVNGCGERSLASVVEHVMTEMFDMIILHFVEELSQHSVPLAKELGASFLWRTARSALSRNKDRTGTLRRRNMSTQSSRAFSLPPLLHLNTSREEMPFECRNPIRDSPAQPHLTDTIATSTGADVFAGMIPYYTMSDLPNDIRETGVFDAVSRDRVAWASMIDSLRLGFTLMDDSEEAGGVGSDVGGGVMLDLDADDVFFRDRLYELSEVRGGKKSMKKVMEPLADDEGLLPPPPLDFTFARRTAFPLLQEKPAVDDELEAAAKKQRDEASLPCPFSKSVYVPDSVKRPSAGVITDKNLYLGRFFLLTDEPNKANDGGATTAVAAATTAWRQHCSMDNPFFPTMKSVIANQKIQEHVPPSTTKASEVTSGDGGEDSATIESSKDEEEQSSEIDLQSLSEDPHARAA